MYKRQVKALNDVAALYAEGLQNGWVHPLDVRAWCDYVAETGYGYSGETVIGAMFLYGTGIKRDAVAAREWLEYGLARPGTQRGNALYMLGMMYFKGDGADQDLNKALGPVSYTHLWMGLPTCGAARPMPPWARVSCI